MLRPAKDDRQHSISGTTKRPGGSHKVPGLLEMAPLERCCRRTEFSRSGYRLHFIDRRGLLHGRWREADFFRFNSCASVFGQYPSRDLLHHIALVSIEAVVGICLARISLADAACDRKELLLGHVGELIH